MARTDAGSAAEQPRRDHPAAPEQPAAGPLVPGAGVETMDRLPDLIRRHSRAYVLAWWRRWLLDAIEVKHTCEDLEAALAAIHERFVARDDRQALEWLRRRAPNRGNLVCVADAVAADWPDEARAVQRERFEAVRAAAFWSHEFAITSERPLTIERTRTNLSPGRGRE